MQIQTGTVDNFTTARESSPNWYQVTFPEKFSGSSSVNVFAQIQTYAGTDTPGLRLRNVSTTGFEVRMDEIRGSHVTSSIVGDLGTVKTNDSHPNAETLAWMAIQI